MPPPEIVRGPVTHEHTDGTTEQVYWFRCTCGEVGIIDLEQYRGEVSILHEECGFHRTVDFREAG